MLHGTNVKIMC